MTIEERLVRRAPEDIIEIGHTLETFYNSNAGTIIRAMINGLITREAVLHMDNIRVSEGRALGRIEGWQTLIDKIEIAIADYKNITLPLPEESNG